MATEKQTLLPVIEIAESAAPGVSDAGKTILYMDSSSKTLKASSDGGGYLDVVGGSGFAGDLGTDVLEFTEQAAPALSVAGDARLYLDSTTKTLKISEDAGAYKDLVTSQGEVITSELLVEAHSTGTTAAAASETDYAWDTEDIDTGSDFDGTTWTVPETGLYHFHIAMEMAFGTGLPSISIKIKQNGSTILISHDEGWSHSSLARNTLVLNESFDLTAGDTIKVTQERVQGTGGTIEGRRFQIASLDGNNIDYRAKASGGSIATPTASGVETFNFITEDRDTDSELDIGADTFTVAETGDYLFAFNARFNYYDFGGHVFLDKNGSGTPLAINYQKNDTTVTHTAFAHIIRVLSLTASDVIRAKWDNTYNGGFQTGQISGATFQAYKLDGSNAKLLVDAEGSNQVFTGGSVDVAWGTELLDVDGALTSTTYTAPRTGNYRILAAVRLNYTSTVDVRVWMSKNGSGNVLVEQNYDNGQAVPWEDTSVFDHTVSLTAGDVIVIHFSTDTSSGSAEGLHFQAIEISGEPAAIVVPSLLELQERSAPPVSAAGASRIYMDSSSKTVKLSEDGGAYADIGGGGGATDHGALTGLGDDDHTQYLPIDASRVMSSHLRIESSFPYFAQQADAGGDPTHYLIASRGTLASPTALINADVVGNLRFQGHDGTGFRDPAQIRAEVHGAVTTGSIPTRLVFRSNPTGIGTATRRIAVDHDGGLTWYESTVPALSAGNESRIYMDSSSKTLKVSEGGGAYTDLVGGGTPGSIATGDESVDTAGNIIEATVGGTSVMQMLSSKTTLQGHTLGGTTGHKLTGGGAGIYHSPAMEFGGKFLTNTETYVVKDVDAAAGGASGLLLIMSSTRFAMVMVRGTTTPSILHSGGGTFSTSQGTGSSINIYISGADLTMENNTGGSLSIGALWLGMSDAPAF
jgi:hypothetical protein